MDCKDMQYVNLEVDPKDDEHYTEIDKVDPDLPKMLKTVNSFYNDCICVDSFSPLKLIHTMFALNLLA